MPITYCVFGEGKNDIGDIDPASNKLINEGCYAGFVRGVCRGTSFQCLQAKPLKNLPLPGSIGRRKKAEKLKGFRRHAFYAARMAATAGADALIIGTDTDRGRGAGSAHRKRIRDMLRYRNEFIEGYQAACRENPEVEAINLIVIVPLCKLESWLLADEGAFVRATGFKRGELPKAPEELYGETDSKTHLDSLFQARKRDILNTELLFKIAKNASPEILSRECPESYPPFRSQCESLKS